MKANNERGAGRKKALNSSEIAEYKMRFRNGETILSLSKEAGVSRQTMSSYLHEESLEEKVISNYTLWAKLNREYREVNIRDYRLRIDYMFEDRCCSVILVDFRNEKIAVINKTENPILRAFGVIAKPSWEDFKWFLRERCIPEGRFQMKQILKDMGLSQYDYLQILEKTEGRTGEDNMWLKFTHFTDSEYAI